MARPRKTGLEYFPLDTELSDDVLLLEEECGIQGFGVWVRLLQTIYRDGYWYEWSERRQKLFCRVNNVTQELLSSVVSVCINHGLLNKRLAEMGILTSKGIQKRFFLATKRREKVVCEEAFLLVNPLDYLSQKQVEIVSVDNNPTEEGFCKHNVDRNPVNVDRNPAQGELLPTKVHKEKKRKEKKSNTAESKDSATQNPDGPYGVTAYYAEKQKAVLGVPMVHTPKEYGMMKRILDPLGAEEVRKRIDLYFATDFWFTKQGRTFGTFIQRINDILPEKGTPAETGTDSAALPPVMDEVPWRKEWRELQEREAANG